MNWMSSVKYGKEDFLFFLFLLLFFFFFFFLFGSLVDVAETR